MSARRRWRPGSTPVNARIREVTTPEGIPLPMVLATVGQRFEALFFDLLLQFLALLALSLVMGLLGIGAWIDDPESSIWAGTFFMLVMFFMRTFYFAWFEVRWQGRTPGKRRAGLRVMDAAAGPLKTEALLVRNLMRELELWLPLQLAFNPGGLLPNAPAGIALGAAAWVLLFAFLPLLNKNRLRAGDMVAGTIVVLAPKRTLLHDIGGQEFSRQQRSEKVTPDFDFTDKQLDAYGIYELQVLEDLLRRTDPLKKDAMKAVARKIRRKIKWKGRPPDDNRFLRAYYAALRARLEKKLVHGKRKEDKHSRE